MRRDGRLPDISLDQAYLNTRSALEAGMLKILSKIGISLLASYHGAQIFEAIGLVRRARLRLRKLSISLLQQIILLDLSSCFSRRSFCL